ncbi:MAG: ABC transporter permease [Treponema sp.]|jgi:ribose transport system permease protein|nr:ABC transporter permease [Treponema sp.]
MGGETNRRLIQKYGHINLRLRSMFARANLQQVIGLALLFIVAALISPVANRTGQNIFLSGANLTDIMRQVSEKGIIALGMTFVILTGGIDLSVGSLLALSATFTANTLTKWKPGIAWGTEIFIVVVLALVICTAFGTLQGALIAKLKVQPFIVTLAGMIGIRGFARFLTTNANIDIGFGDDISALFAKTIQNKTIVICTFIGLAIIFGIILARTVFGLQVKSVGDNPVASLYAGLPVTKTLIYTYAISGFLVGIAGVLHCAQNHQGNPNDGVSYELDAIAAVVIGGTSMTGGKGTITGTIIGAFILGILTNIFRLKGVDINVEMMCKSVIIVIAVWLQMPRKVKNAARRQVTINVQ